MPQQDAATSPLHHGFFEVFLPVGDVDRAKAFYIDKLGFSLGHQESASSALLLYTEGATRWMLGLSRVTHVERRHHVSFRVRAADVDQMLPYLRARGIEPVHPARASREGPVHEPIVHGWMPAAAVFFEDPDGHLLELIADLPDDPRPELLFCPLSEWRALRAARKDRTREQS